jgi:hypothetical protein
MYMYECVCVYIGSVMYVLLRKLRSPYVLPCCMAVVLVSFYSLLLLFGISFQQARDAGWIAPLSPVGENLPIYVCAYYSVDELFLF